MRYALIGCGRISKNHIVAAKNNNLEIVALCDLDISKAEKLIETHELDGTKVYADFRKMLDEENIELVAIATESGSHARIALECIKRGCNVLIEKPMALSVKDADAIIAAAEKKHVKVGVVHQNRFNKAIIKLREALESGELGKVLYGVANIRWSRNKDYYKSGNWRGTWENDGGALMNQSIHDIDLLCWMLGGKIESVQGVVDNKIHDYIEVEDFGVGIIKSTTGAYGIIEATTNMYLRNYEELLCIFCEKGTIKIGGQAVNSIEDWITENIDLTDAKAFKQENSEMPSNVYGYGHTKLYRNVMDAIIYDREPLVNGIEGKKALEVILAIYKSNLEKRIIHLPLLDAATTDFKGMICRKENGVKDGSFFDECKATV